MFDALRQGDPHLTETVRSAPRPEPVAHAIPEDDDELVETSDAPFIEVGPNRSIETSPGLLDLPPAAPPRTPSLPTDEEPVLALPVDDEPSPLTVSFLPTAAPPTAEGPAPRPRIRLGPELVSFHCPEHAASTRYEEVLATMLAGAVAERPRAFFFTSALFDAGTTTVLLNLAITAARRGRRRVAVVDANLRRPAIASRLHVEEAPGLRDVLAGTATLDEAVQDAEPINLFAVTAGERHPDTGLRVVAGTMRSLLRDLRQRFDLLLVDGPRWDGRPEVVAAGAACDAVYVVMPETEAESPQLDHLFQVIPEQGARLGGCILTSPRIY
jgi:Mrp family chromosome partitioning ATPase